MLTNDTTLHGFVPQSIVTFLSRRTIHESLLLRYLPLIALVCSQLAFSAHQLTHQHGHGHNHEHGDSGGIRDVCAICLALERDDDVLVFTAEIAQRFTVESTLSLPIPATVSTESIVYHQPRDSPPVLL